MTESENWGFAIKRLRENRGWTQDDLSKHSGIGRGYIAKIEIGLIKSPTRDTFAALAKGFSITLDELNEEITGQHLKSQTETSDQILERLRLAQPLSIPVYSDFPVHAGEGIEPVDFVYLPRMGRTRKGIEAYIVHGDCLSPSVEDGDVIIVDREAEINVGNIVACLFSGEFHLGRLKKIGDQLWLENGHGTNKLQDCQAAAKVIQVIRRL